MNESTNGCADVRELVPWYPTGTLTDDEAHRVEAHVSECENCAGLLDFSAEMKETMVTARASHPAPDLLVGFVENATGLSSSEREAVEAHIPVCASCREQAGLLEQVDRQIDRDDAAAVGSHTQRDRARSPFVRFWASLRHGVLSPVPAAIYLVVAVAAVGLLLVSPGDELLPTTDVGIGAAGVIILPDEGDRVRQAIHEETRGPTIDASATRLLLLELTGLQSPPGDEDTYTVSFLPSGGEMPVLSTTVLGAEFRKNYTIGFILRVGALDAGDYTVTVADPAGEQVFRSTVTIRQ